MKPMSVTQQKEHRQTVLAIRGALSSLRLSRCEDEDIRGAMMRLEEWLEENDGRWVK